MKLTVSPPSDKQRKFFEAKTRYVAYGGARGGGKSWAVRTKAILMAAKYPGIRILIMRKTYPELRENHILPLSAALVGFADYSESKKVFSFINGSRIKFGYCDTECDVSQYQGQEYDIVFMDEATHFTEYQYNAVKSCIRGANGFPKRMYITCNPGGVGHGWVKRLFIDRQYREGENPEDYTFIPARVYDNKVLMEKDPEYVKTLLSLPEDMKSAWLDGNWDAFAGQFFPEFKREVHVVPPHDLPEGARVFRAFDYGLDMLACLWISLDRFGRAYVFREVHASNLIVSDAARLIAENSPEEVYCTYAPPDMWSRQRETGASIAELFGENGIDIVRASNSRVTGWLAVKEWLKIKETAGGCLPGIEISSACPFLIRCISELCYDEKNSCDASCDPHEITHITDALRYFCASRPVPATERTYPSPLEKYRKKVIGRGKQRKGRTFS